MTPISLKSTLSRYLPQATQQEAADWDPQMTCILDLAQPGVRPTGQIGT